MKAYDLFHFQIFEIKIVQKIQNIDYFYFSAGTNEKSRK